MPIPTVIAQHENPKGALTPIVEYPTEALPAGGEVIIRGSNFGNESSTIVVYIGITECFDVKILVPGKKIKCTIFFPGEFQVIPRYSIPIHILVDGVKGTTNNMFLFTDTQKCLERCDGFNGNCTYGICQCLGIEYVGPLCNLDQFESHINSNTQLPVVDYFHDPSIVWTIYFKELTRYNNESCIYEPFLSLRDFNWTITYDDNKYTRAYHLEVDDVIVNIRIRQIPQETMEPFAGIDSFLRKNALQYSINLIRKKKPPTATMLMAQNNDGEYIGVDDKVLPRYQIHLKIETTVQTIPGCDTSSIIFDHGRGYNRNDIRWVTVQKDNASVFGRFTGRCLSDGLPQRCDYDINEDPVAQMKGNVEMLIRFQPWFDNVTIQPDFLIMNYSDNPVSIQIICMEKIPHQLITRWLLPTLLPVVALCVACLTIVVCNLLKVNRKSLEFEDIDGSGITDTNSELESMSDPDSDFEESELSDPSSFN
eukprot:gene664-823_t